MTSVNSALSESRSSPTSRHLSGERVQATVIALRDRIAIRFPDNRLTEVAAELVGLVDHVDQHTRDTQRRVVRTTLVARVLAAVALVLAGTLLALALRQVLTNTGGQGTTWIPLLESTINTMILIALGVLFLWAVPERRERKGLLSLLHQLRSVAHVLDMHQLTKEPGRLRRGYVATAHSLPNDLTADQMYDYLSYCIELLSLIAKTAALCAERSSDDTVLDTVSDVETLTTELSSTIFQKMAQLSLLDRP